MNFMKEQIELETDRCCRYLLDEMSPQDVRDFEAQLEISSELCDELARCANVLATVGEAASFTRRDPSVTLSHPQRSQRRWTAITAGVAISAGLLIAIGISANKGAQSKGSQYDPVAQRGDTQESLALAWASNRSERAIAEIVPEQAMIAESESDGDTGELPSWLAVGVSEVMRENNALEAEDV